MSEKTETESLAHLAQQAMEPSPIAPGSLYAVADSEGGVQFLDTDEYGDRPRRTEAYRKVSDAESFVKYLAKHSLPQTEVFADTPRSSVVAVIDSHGAADLAAGDPGWQVHKLALELEHTKSWKAWTDRDGTWFSQLEFAEFIEQRATDVVTPKAGDLMSLAQTLYMTKGVEFESSERMSDGQTQLVYKEKISTKGLGKMELPKELMLALQPYVGGPRQYAHAIFRTSISGSSARIGYVLVRPEEILEGVFADIVAEIRDGRNQSLGKVAFDGITAPIFFGRP